MKVIQWDKNRRKPANIGERRKSQLQLACMRDHAYLTAATKTPMPKGTLHITIEQEPKTRDEIPEFDLRHRLLPMFRPVLLSPIRSPPRYATEPVQQPMFAPLPALLSPIPPAPQDTEKLFEGIRVRWNRRYDRVKNSCGETVRIVVNYGTAYLKHIPTQTKTTITRSRQ